MQFPSHGANYESLYQNFGIKMPEKVFDLSENVNFLGAPNAVKEEWPNLLPKIQAYPHPQAEPLRSLLAHSHRVKPTQILVGNGAAELLTFFAQRFAGKRVILIHPTFSEYKMSLEAAGAVIEDIIISDVKNYKLPIQQIKAAMNSASCLYLCNPNNPTGSLIKRDVLEEFITYGEEVGCEILVDEAFMDWTDEEHSVISLINQYSNVTVMRSMTKMYGIAGVRLGYLISRVQLVQELASKLPHWNVNALALAIGEICLMDQTFRKESIMKSRALKEKIEDFLINRGCEITKSAANFLCFQLKEPSKTRDLYFYCLEHGVVLRHTENYLGMDGQWLRIGMKGSRAVETFMKVMDEWHEQS